MGCCLEKGCARTLFGDMISPKSQKILSEYERNIVGYIITILSASQIPTCWVDEPHLHLELAQCQFKMLWS
jgi:hypothetical protein